MEIWKDVPSQEYIQVSNLGRVRRKEHIKQYMSGNRWKTKETLRVRLFKQRVLKCRDNGHGYRAINLNNKTYYVHRWVAEAFLGPSELQVNHIDGNKTNNNINNLEYVTQSENLRHASRLGLNCTIPRQTIEIIKDLHSRGFGPKAIGEFVGLSRGSVANITAGRTRVY